VFVLPVLTYIWPEAARSCLLYRHRTLDAARKRARSFGYAGALYPWESTDTGEDRTPAGATLPSGAVLRILNGEQEHHISAAVPWAVMQYWRATGDEAFMLDYGADMLVECARFWNSRVSPTEDGFSVRKVIGPDEYHLSVDNDAYTNAMARWTLSEAGAFASDLLNNRSEVTDAIIARLEIRDGEPAEWTRVADAISRSRFEPDALVEQFDGFFALRPVDVAAYRREGTPIDIALGADAVQASRALKQADVLMSAALLPGIWSEASLRRNFDYYEPIAAHSSSLSPPVHALLAAWLRDEGRCRTYLDETMRIDLAGGFRNAAGGVHLAALGGLWQTVVFGLAGFKCTAEEVSFDPFLPAPLEGLSFTLRWRGRRLAIALRPGELTVTVTGAPCTVRVNGDRRLVPEGGSAAFVFDQHATFWSATGKDGAA
jgi:kojibiose phosphorylase